MLGSEKMGNISSACSTDDSELAPPARAPAELPAAGGGGVFLTSQRGAIGTTTAVPAVASQLDPATIGTAAALLQVLHTALENAADVLDALCATAARAPRKEAVALLDRAAAAQAVLSPARACELLIALQPGRSAALFKRLNAVRALRPAAATEADSAAIIALLEALEEFEKQSSEMAFEPGAPDGDAEEQGPGQHGQEQEPAEIMALRAELRCLSVGALRKQVRAAGVDGDVLEGARDSDDPKAALVELLVQRRRDVGALADVLPALKAGGKEADSVLGACLEHAVEVLDLVSMSLGRRERKSVMGLLDRVDRVVSDVGLDWCEGLVQCSVAELEMLGSSVVAVTALVMGGAGGGGGGEASSGAAQSAVLELLDCVERCGSAVLRALAVLSGGEQSEEVLVIALEALRLMSDDHQESVSMEEVAAGIAILPHLVDERLLSVSANMALFTLACRNGIELCLAEGVWEALCAAATTGLQPLMASSSCASGTVSMDVALDLASASLSLFGLTIEAVGKTPLGQRAAHEVSTMGAVSKCIKSTTTMPDDAILQMWSSAVVERKLLAQGPDAKGGSLFWHGTCWAAFMMLYTRPQLIGALQSTGLFDSMWNRYRHSFATALSAEWWSSKSDVVDVRTARLAGVVNVLLLPVRGLVTDTLTASAWWPPWLQELIHIVKVNHAARLPEKETMSAQVMIITLNTISTAASKMLLPLEPSIVEALEYATMHDFHAVGKSVSAEAAGTLVALLGRNEDGKTLSPACVNSVMADLKLNLTFEQHRKLKPLSTILSIVKNVGTMAISDTNKMLMMDSKGAIDTLLTGLLLTSARRSEKGANAVQEACVELLLSLALHGPWAEKLRAHVGAISALHDLCEGGLGTEASRRSAESILFELEGRTVQAAESNFSSKHVMISYCWDQQAVIKRVHAALVKRGYNIWIDIEQMKGSTVDSMAAAVEGAVVMLIGVSRQYKESTNCRLEAQYAMQREVQTIPLMLAEKYQADGWLGMLIGTRMWYGFYGAVLSDDSAFEIKVSELCRDLGVRGRRGAAGRSLLPPDDRGAEEDKKQTDSGGGELEQFKLGLMQQRMAVLKKQAREGGVSAEAVGEVDESDDPKYAIVTILLALRRQELLLQSDSKADFKVKDQLEAVKAELKSMTLRALKQRAIQEHQLDAETVEACDDEDDPKAALLVLILESVQAQLVQATAGDAAAVALERLKVEYAPMTLRTLKKKALADGVDAEAVEMADDDNNPRETVLRLLLGTLAVGGV